jgi:hypothetical protein
LICWATKQRWCLLIHWAMMLFVDLLKNEIKLVLLDCQTTKQKKCLLIH